MKRRFLSCTILLFAALILAAPARAVNVQICHVPPGNPANFHTIIINVVALLSHLLHGDLPGPCSANCSQLCDDDNACTIDACDAHGHCAATHPPVDCNDGNLCTTDTCNSATGCSSTPLVCQDSNLCTIDACDPLSGQCVFPPVSCEAGQTCNPGNGNCEGDACTPNPCQNGGTCQASGSGYTCTCAPGWTGMNCEINEPVGCPAPPLGTICPCVGAIPGFTEGLMNPGTCFDGGTNILKIGSGPSAINAQCTPTPGCSSLSGVLLITPVEASACVQLIRASCAAAD